MLRTREGHWGLTGYYLGGRASLDGSRSAFAPRVAWSRSGGVPASSRRRRTVGSDVMVSRVRMLPRHDVAAQRFLQSARQLVAWTQHARGGDHQTAEHLLVGSARVSAG
jgi:hypothetical protein